MADIETGSSATEEQVAGDADLASSLATSGMHFPPVYATSRMVALMELACARLMLPLLASGELSVGATVDIRHTAATPQGSRVRATATFREREGKLFVFDVVAHDEAGEIGRGTHKRAIINEARLMESAAKRKK